MAKKEMIIKPVAAAVSVAFVSSVAFSTVATAADNPFTADELDSGYMLAGEHEGEEGKCGEGKCGEGDKEDGEGKCGEGKCGGDGDHDKDGEGKCGEGKCGDDKDAEEGKCGEGKCGGAA